MFADNRDTPSPWCSGSTGDHLPAHGPRVKLTHRESREEDRSYSSSGSCNPHYNSTDAKAVSIPILQIGKLKLGEVKQPVVSLWS